MLSQNYMIKCLLLLACCVCGLTSCEKYLDAKSDQKLNIPATIRDLQALLDDNTQINQRQPTAGEVSADDYYLIPTNYTAANEFVRKQYTWDRGEQFARGASNDWSFNYTIVYKANLVLDNLGRITRTANDQESFNQAKGHALFLRGQSFLQIASIWAQAYDATNASTAPGIPLRLDPDFNLASVRASIQQTYDQIIADLKEAVSLLPVHPIHMLRPSRPGAYGVLARTYLFMRKYDSCGKYADLSLQLKGSLKDYNTMDTSASIQYSFAPRFSNSEEIITEFSFNTAALLSVAKIDSTLYDLYDNTDIRKKLYFRKNPDGTFFFKGSYTANIGLFNGIATDENFLMRAECYARAGELVPALNDLNSLLEKRYYTGHFVPVTAVDAADALNKILVERRKELLMRGLRWPDIKRLNREGANINLTRKINDQTYTLPAGDPRFALAIPADVIEESGMPQNPR